MLVKNIVQQRDLYRALLVKNDASLLTEYGADGAIVAAKDQIEKFTEVEAQNKQLGDSIAKLKSDLVSSTNEKIGLEERLARLDAHTNELSSTNIKLQSDLLAANSSVARVNAEATFHLEKTPRRKSTRLNSSHITKSYAVFCLKKKHLNSSHTVISYAVFCLKKKTKNTQPCKYN